MSEKDKKISQYTERLGGIFLFDIGKPETKREEENRNYSHGLDMRTRITNPDMFKAIAYYGVIGSRYDSEIAFEIKDLLERLLISFEGGGRAEAVEVLRQNFPKKVEVEKGFERLDDV